MVQAIENPYSCLPPPYISKKLTKATINSKLTLKNNSTNSSPTRKLEGKDEQNISFLSKRKTNSNSISIKSSLSQRRLSVNN